eukprot:g17685.t1
MEVHREQTSKAKKGSKPPVLRKTLLLNLHTSQARAAVDSLEVPDSFPDFAEMKEVPQVPVEDPDEAKTTKKGAKKRKAEKNAEATETAPKKAARSLSAFFTKEADGNDEQIREMPETEC